MSSIFLHRAGIGERRLVQVTALNRYAVIPHNFRVLRGWTQARAAEWYGVSERTWRRWESHGAPEHVLKRIKVYSDRRGGNDELWLT